MRRLNQKMHVLGALARSLENIYIEVTENIVAAVMLIGSVSKAGGQKAVRRPLST